VSGGVEVKVVASVRSLSSRWVAWAFAVAYVVVSTAVGAALLVMPKTDAATAENPTTYISDDMPTVLASPAPAGFQRVRGPAGMETVIPDGWLTVAAGGPGAMRAVDPSDAGRIVGFGGAAADSTDIVRIHVDYEGRFADRTTEYRRLGLNSATYGGHPAVEWKFQHEDGRGLQRVHALYWLVGHTEYFVFASGPDAQWSRMEPVYEAMVANSRP
jgi:hypothetical protein